MECMDQGFNSKDRKMKEVTEETLLDWIEDVKCKEGEDIRVMLNGCIKDNYEAQR